MFDTRRPWPSPDVAEKRLTLVTCYPFDAIVPGGPLRYLLFVEAEPIWSVGMDRRRCPNHFDEVSAVSCADASNLAACFPAQAQ